METLFNQIDNTIISLACIVNQDNADEIHEAAITLTNCKESIKELLNEN